jgi:BCD family chlorophyll transporter-like MFS transporter
MGVPAWLVSLMVALPVLFAPLRALIGFKSDHHRSAFGWRRVPYIWFGSLMQFGGLAIMPFALLLLAEGGSGPPMVGQLGAAMAFLLAGAGLHTTQTAGLALATDIAPKMSRPRVVALLFVAAAQHARQRAAVRPAAHGLQPDAPDPGDPGRRGRDHRAQRRRAVAGGWDRRPEKRRNRAGAPRPSFREPGAPSSRPGRSKRLLVALGLGTAGFSMQDILLEPYGGEVLG